VSSADCVSVPVNGFSVNEDLLRRIEYLIHDRDAKYTQAFDGILGSAAIKAVRLPPHSPNLNAFAERFVRSIKTECLDQFVLFGEKSLRHVVREYLAHYHVERNHQGIGNVIPFPDPQVGMRTGAVVKSERLGGCSATTIARRLLPALR
jgi:putative transposase